MNTMSQGDRMAGGPGAVGDRCAPPDCTSRAEHPIVAVVTHWVHLATLGILIWTGCWMHSPFYGASFHTVRTVHLWAALFFVIAGVVRFYWAIFGGGSSGVATDTRRRDFWWFLPGRGDLRLALQTVKYYLFLSKTHPHAAKYNPLQKAAYLALIPLFVLIVLTGLELWEPTASALLPVTYFFGGPVIVRFIHYIVMWLYIVIALIHIYLALAETIYQVPLMFAWQTRKTARSGWRGERITRPSRREEH